MAEVSAVGIFCEDIREEKSGQNTLVGVLPDAINIAGAPAMLAKLCVYVRIHISPADADPGPISARIIMPDGTELVANEVEKEKIVTAREKAIAGGNPILGFILRFSATPLPVATPGRILAEVTIGPHKSICGSLALNLTPSPT